MRKAIKRHRQFERNFRRRIAKNPKLFAAFEERLRQFMDGVRDTRLNDHPLTGQLAGQRAFSVTGDVRVVYIETEADVILLDVGTHNQVYGD
jgi:addiction module RelE/StbE family toxin